MAQQLEEYDPFDLPVIVIRVVDDFDMDESQGPHRSVLWIRRSFTTCTFEVLSLCNQKEGGALMGHWVAQAVEQHVNKKTALEATDEKLEADLPAIFDFLTCTVGEAGKPRAVGSLTIFARTGAWHACLKDRQTKKTWWAEGDCVESALKALDAALQGR